MKQCKKVKPNLMTNSIKQHNYLSNHYTINMTTVPKRVYYFTNDTYGPSPLRMLWAEYTP